MDLLGKLGDLAKNINNSQAIGGVGDKINSFMGPQGGQPSQAAQPSQVSGGEIFCPQCGSKNPPGKFCSSCGSPLGSAQNSAGTPAGAPGALTPPRKPDEIEYKIYGEDLQFVEIILDPGETVIAEAGAMMYMDRDIKMETIFGDGSASGGGGGIADKLLSAGKRLISGAGLFMTAFQNQGAGRENVAFAAPYPGTIVTADLAQMGGTLICQKDAFLCAARGISVSVAFQKKIGVGLFGGEGFIMQRLDGDGLAFLHAGGAIIRRDLAAGEMIKLDTGCLVAMDPGVNYDIQFMGGIKDALFGGEGLALATLEGPGAVWLQSLPFSRLADRIIAASKTRQGEGSVLGGIGIGTFLGGNKS
ncbi:MAG: TIGR00266 family protein [Synergistaceae bacterium]|jgi:uncharacterized protein (TIGR00266 family)|nr:TIGR00266 family protein [Synergistaceae bacterium]